MTNDDDFIFNIYFVINMTKSSFNEKKNGKPSFNFK